MSSAINALHNAARSYCLQRIGLWQKRYAALTAAGQERTERRDGQKDYTAEAYNTFPRYNVLRAVLQEVERFVPGDFASLDDARGLLALAGDTAPSKSTSPLNEIELSAMNEERELFIAYMRTAQAPECMALPSLPFRRVLGNTEHDQLHAAFVNKWGKWCGGGVDRNDLPPYVTLHTAVMDGPEAHLTLRRALADRGLRRVLELREGGDGYEVDLELVNFNYTGGEGWWTTSPFAWMVYVSHEDSITFGGADLVGAMRAELAEFQRYIYKGWDPAKYQ